MARELLLIVMNSYLFLRTKTRREMRCIVIVKMEREDDDKHKLKSIENDKTACVTNLSLVVLFFCLFLTAAAFTSVVVVRGDVGSKPLLRLSARGSSCFCMHKKMNE
jgi:hypothetical protein